ncbi:uncharacterized protein EV154DRAFT_483925 [Mucor mucedo]|uniref:uncharacterized protein n=1 Tax=Mucor mucedo TaxID=29922 RepID=UPI00221E42EE|nr:uncharacterized protein EV154DRAFT_483925 [Mucor mucedo]KAI7888582.1 hypothetical protein EV154DRAFT_483925 [Mucor mucedo]
MGKSKIALWREMEQFKRQMLLNPGYELSETQAPSYNPMSMFEYPPDDENIMTVVLHNCTMDPSPAPASRKCRRIRIRSPGPIVKAIPAKVSPAEAKNERTIGYQRKLEALANKWAKFSKTCVPITLFLLVSKVACHPPRLFLQLHSIAIVVVKKYF